MKKVFLKKLITIAILLIAVVAVVEFQKFMKRRGDECANGICKTPEGHGLVVNPFPTEIIPAQSAQKNPLPQLIDFGAGKCATCKMMNAVLQELSAEYKDRLLIQFVDVWENEEASKEYAIRMIPTQIFLDAEGSELFRHEGFISKEDILKKWAELGINVISNE